MKYIKKLVGTTIYLSPMSVEDAQQYTIWMNDFKVTDGLGTSTMLLGLEQEKEWIRKNQSEHQFAIVRLEDDKLLGNCGLQEIFHIRQCAEVGLFIGDEEHRNQGYGSQALQLLLEYGFDYLNLHNIMLKVFSFNQRAIRCYEKVGFYEIGRRREAYYLKGMFHDEVYMDILKSEYKVPCEDKRKSLE